MRTLDRARFIVVALAASATAAPAAATAVAGPGGSAQPGRQVVVAAPAVAGTPAAELIAAAIQAVQIDRAQLVVHGKPVPWDPVRLKVYRGAQSVGASALRPGQTIRFALESATAEPRRIVLILIDR
jgi:hypothetical protein